MLENENSHKSGHPNGMVQILLNGFGILIMEHGWFNTLVLFVLLPAFVANYLYGPALLNWNLFVSIYGVFSSVTVGFLINTLFMTISRDFFPKHPSGMGPIEQERYIRRPRQLVIYAVVVGISTVVLLVLVALGVWQYLCFLALFMATHYLLVLLDIIEKVHWITLRGSG